MRRVVLDGCVWVFVLVALECCFFFVCVWVWVRARAKHGRVTYLVGDDIELLLVLALHVDGALDAREVGDGRALHQRGDLLARRGDAGQHDGHLVVDRTGPLLLQQPRGQRHDLVAARLRARRLRRRGRSSVHGRHAPHVSGRRLLGCDPAGGPSGLAEEGEAASEGGRLLAGEKEQVGGGGGGGGHCCWWHVRSPSLL